MWPQVTRGSGTTEHSLIIENQGNRAEVVKLAAADDSGELRLDLPASVTAGPGRTFVPIKVVVVGQADGRTIRFSVTATPRDRAPIVLSGSRAIPAKPQPKPRPEPKPRPQPPPQPQVVYLPPQAQARRGGCLGGFVKLVVWLVILAGLVAAAAWAYENVPEVRNWLESLS